MSNHQVNLLFICHIMTQFMFLIFESLVEEELTEIIEFLLYNKYIEKQILFSI